MKDLNEMMKEAMEKIENDGLIERTVRDQLEKTIGETIKDTFKSYSPFGKQLKEAIAAEIKVDFDALSLGMYSTTITTMVSNILKEKMEGDARAEAERFLTKIESDEIPGELKITDMVRHIVGCWKDNDEGLSNDGFEFTFHFIQRWPESSSLKHCYQILLDKELDVEPRACEIEIDYKDDKQEIDDITVGGRSPKLDLVYTTRNWNLEGYLFGLYASKAKLINDADEVETYVAGYYED